MAEWLAAANFSRSMPLRRSVVVLEFKDLPSQKVSQSGPGNDKVMLRWFISETDVRFEGKLFES